MVYIPYPRTDLYNHVKLISWRNKLKKIDGDWTSLKEYLADSPRLISDIHPLTKCWYSEMFQGDNYALDVEHFRPKNQANPLTPKQIKEIKNLAGVDYEQDLTSTNYNWLEFDYRNYRIVSAITNRGGAKHIYFPIAKNTLRLNTGQLPWVNNEYPYFLDPTNRHDASLLFVKPNGEISPITPKTELTDYDFDNIATRWHTNGFNYLRAIVTIQLYRLNDNIFIKARKEVYDDITFRLETLSLLLNENPDSIIKKRLIDDISKLLLPSAQFSLAAISSMKAYVPSATINLEIIELMNHITTEILKAIQEKIDTFQKDWTRQ